MVVPLDAGSEAGAGGERHVDVGGGAAGEGDDVGAAVAVDVADRRDLGADGEEVVPLDARGVAGAGGEPDVDVGAVATGERDDVGAAIAVDVAGERHLRADGEEVVPGPAVRHEPGAVGERREHVGGGAAGEVDGVVAAVAVGVAGVAGTGGGRHLGRGRGGVARPVDGNDPVVAGLRGRQRTVPEHGGTCGADQVGGGDRHPRVPGRVDAVGDHADVVGGGGPGQAQRVHAPAGQGETGDRGRGDSVGERRDHAVGQVSGGGPGRRAARRGELDGHRRPARRQRRGQYELVGQPALPVVAQRLEPHPGRCAVHRHGRLLVATGLVTVAAQPYPLVGRVDRQPEADRGGGGTDLAGLRDVVVVALEGGGERGLGRRGVGVRVRGAAGGVAGDDGVGPARGHGALGVEERGRGVLGGHVVGRSVLDAEAQRGAVRHRVADHQPVGGVALVGASAAADQVRGVAGEDTAVLAAVEVPARLVEVLGAGAVDLRRGRAVHVHPLVALQVVAGIAADNVAPHGLRDADEPAPAGLVGDDPVRAADRLSAA